MKLTGNIKIDQPPSSVFAFISDPASISSLPGGGGFVGWTSEATHGVGSAFEFDVRVLGLTVRSQAEVIAWIPSKLYARKATTKLLGAEFSFALEEENGGTRLSCQGDVKFRGLLRAAEPLFSRLLAKRFNADLIAIGNMTKDGARESVA